jgi:hypothetical protein
MDARILLDKPGLLPLAVLLLLHALRLLVSNCFDSFSLFFSNWMMVFRAIQKLSYLLKAESYGSSALKTVKLQFASPSTNICIRQQPK